MTHIELHFQNDVCSLQVAILSGRCLSCSHQQENSAVVSSKSKKGNAQRPHDWLVLGGIIRNRAKNDRQLSRSRIHHPPTWPTNNNFSGNVFCWSLELCEPLSHSKIMALMHADASQMQGAIKGIEWRLVCWQSIAWHQWEFVWSESLILLETISCYQATQDQ